MILAGDPPKEVLRIAGFKRAPRPSGAQSRLAGLCAVHGPTTSRARGGFGLIATVLKDVLRVAWSTRRTRAI